MFVLEQLRKFAETDRIALVNREEKLSFRELNSRSESFAVWLLEHFGDDRSPVVIYGRKETDFLACIYGTLKSGRPYIPIDTATPPGRAMEILNDVSPKVIVNFSGNKLSVRATVLDGASLPAVLQFPSKAEIPSEIWASGEQTAYILFTSGSTGKPKGVPITVNNLTSFYHGLLPYMEESGDVILNQVSYSFDVSGCSVYAGLSRGMTLFTVDSEMLDDMGALFDFLRDSGLTTWVSTPSFAELCIQSPKFSGRMMPALRCFMFCGEVLTHKLCDGLAERFPGASILNTYGPTEATVLVTAVWINAEMRLSSRSIPIGQPLETVELRIVDEHNYPVMQNEVCGELLILGDSVGPGYHECPDLTEQRFFEESYAGKRGYRTGDICYHRDGLYYYTGRADNQLKLNGYRVEIEDIENNLTRVENISRAAVVPVLEQGRVQYLAAFLLLEKDDGLTPLKRSVQIRQRAAAYLPAYMIPRKLVAVDAFPLNLSGKVDKRELAARLNGTTP